MKNVIRSVYAVALIILATLGWQMYSVFDEHFSSTKRQLEEAKEKISLLEISNQKLEMANTFLKKTRRLAVISDIVKEIQEGSDAVKTTFSFSEVDLSDTPIGEKRTFTIDGDVLYVDTLTIKFEDDFVEQGDILKGSALCLLNRLFSEKQKPEDGFRLDAEGETPKPYKLDSPDTSEFEKELWGNFWKLAQDPVFAKKMGVRAAHGQAASMKLQEGATYKLEMRNTGEQSFVIQ